MLKLLLYVNLIFLTNNLYLSATDSSPSLLTENDRAFLRLQQQRYPTLPQSSFTFDHIVQNAQFEDYKPVTKKRKLNESQETNPIYDMSADQSAKQHNFDINNLISMNMDDRKTIEFYTILMQDTDINPALKTY